MARVLKPVLRKDGKLSVRRAVAYILIVEFPTPYRVSAFMLSVYVESYKYQKTDEAMCWSMASRMYVPRSTTEEQQKMYLDTLTNAMAARHNRDYEIVLEASFKKPKEMPDGLQRPFIER